jgi:hypothetical protein
MQMGFSYCMQISLTQAINRFGVLICFLDCCTNKGTSLEGFKIRQNWREVIQDKPKHSCRASEFNPRMFLPLDQERQLRHDEKDHVSGT